MPAARKRSTTKRKTTAKRTTAKRSTAKRKTARKTTAKKSNVTYLNVAKTSAIRDKLTKSQQFNEIAEMTGLTRKQVQAVFEAQENIIERSIRKGGVGQITLPLGIKIEVKKKPARKARKGVNPFTGEEMMFKAKPASRVVKIRPLKRLKDYAG